MSNKTNKKNKKDQSQKQIKEIYGLQGPDNFQKPINRRLYWFILIILPIGLVGGVLGTFLFLSVKNVDLPLIGAFNLDDQLPKREITVKTQENVTVTEDERMKDLADKLLPQQINIYFKKSKQEDVLNQIYYVQQSLGKAFILSSDGWLVTHKNIFNSVEAEGNKVPEYLAITSDNTIYPINKILFDPLTDIVFLKIEAKNLPVAMLANSKEIESGQNIFAFNKSNELRTGRVAKIGYWPIDKKENLVKSIDKFSEYILIDDKFNQDFVGSAIIDLSTKTLGIINQPGQAIPTSYLKNLLDQVLKYGQDLRSGTVLYRSVLQIDYLELSQIAGLEDKIYANEKEGVLVYGVPEKGTLAAAAGIKDGDIILKVNNDFINKGQSLLELICKYELGEKVELTLKRAGQEKKIEVKLGKVE